MGKMSFRSKLLFAILLPALLCIAVIWGNSYHRSMAQIERDSIDSIERTLKDKTEQLDGYFKTAYFAAVRLAAEPAFQTESAAFAAPGEQTAERALRLAERMKSQIPEGGLIDAIYLYLPAVGTVVSSDEHHMLENAATAVPFDRSFWENARQTGIQPMALSSTGGTPELYYAYVRDVADPTGQTIGRLMVSIKERVLYYALLDEFGRDEYTQCYLLDGAGQVVSSRFVGDIGLPADTLAELPALTSTVQAGGCRREGARMLYAAQQGGFSGCRLLYLTDRAHLTQDLRQQQIMLPFILLIVLIAVLLAQLLSRWIYRPVGRLMSAMDAVGEGKLDTRVQLSATDELQQLGSRFNEMAMRIRELVEQQVRDRLAYKQAEMRALQHQIKPHFMYNTLNTIRYTALLQNDKKVGEQLADFIALLEASTNKHGTFLTLREEIALVEHYVALQRYRYMNCFTVAYEIEDAAMDCFVPRLLLQPLVENAVLHGMDIKRSDNRIGISAKTANDVLTISVRDNGKGMTETQAQRLLDGQDETHRQFTGIGLSNVRERLALYYGGKSGFSLTSAPGQGTEIVLTLPISRDPAEFTIDSDLDVMEGQP